MQHSVPHVLPPCKHEANKNVVEARLKGTGMHWQRTHVNPMLALRNAICSDRWQEMWKKALKHHRKLHTLQRSVRVKPGAPSVLAVGTSSSVESPPPSAATSKPLSSPAHSLGAQPSSSCRPSTVGKRQRAHHRVNSSPHRSGEGSRDTCFCGTPLARFKGHRPKQYCSDRCRQHAHRQRHTQTKPFPGSSRAPASQRRKRAAVLRVRVSSQRSTGVRGEMCLFCGTGLLHSREAE